MIVNEAAERGKPAEGPRQLTRNDPNLVRVAFREARQSLQVLVGEKLAVRVAVVDRLEHRGDGLGLALRREDLRFPLALSPQDRGLFRALSAQDLALLDALGRQDRGPAVPLGAHLFFHRVLD